VTAKWITAEEARNPEYWAGHVRQTVRFADGVAELMKDAQAILLEVGPGQTLSTLARQHPGKAAEQNVIASLPIAGEQESRGLMEALGRLWMSGVTIDWQEFYAGERRRRVALPAYPFERKRYWPESPISARAGAAKTQIPAPANEREAATNVSSASVPSMPTTLESSQAAGQIEAVAPRQERLLAASRKLLEELSGYDLSEVDAASSLMEMGLDSLLLTQAAQIFQKKFGVAISFRQLMEELSSLQEIAVYLDSKMAPEAFAATAKPATVAGWQAQTQPQAAANTGLGGASVPGSVLEQILLQQQQLTQQVLQLMGRGGAAGVPTAVAPADTPSNSGHTGQSVAMVIRSEAKSHGPFKPIDRAASMASTP
jgi:acyl transferase domain-containing protein